MTHCPEQLTFDFHPRQAVVADFQGGLISSDAGLLPIRQLDQRPGWSAASAETIRSRLIKIGARVRRTVRRVWVHLAEAFPLREILARAHRAILRLHPPPLNARLKKLVADQALDLQIVREALDVAEASEPGAAAGDPPAGPAASGLFATSGVRGDGHGAERAAVSAGAWGA